MEPRSQVLLWKLLLLQSAWPHLRSWSMTVRWQLAGALPSPSTSAPPTSASPAASGPAALRTGWGVAPGGQGGQGRGAGPQQVQGLPVGQALVALPQGRRHWPRFLRVAFGDQPPVPGGRVLPSSPAGSAVLLSSGPPGSAPAGSSVVSESAVSWPAGGPAVLRCQSPRMVWTQDRLNDRQRVVHWDLSGGPGGRPAQRLVDMYSAGEQRVYARRDRGRLLLSTSAFQDGNFSLLLRAVEETDAGLYTCNLHHHYCHLYESLAILLRVTDNPREAGAHWDGEKEVLVAELGSPALLTCVNRAHVWTDRHLEEAQQVVHWDRQPPGVPHDRADRLLDLYASGERRAYGPPFLRDRVAVEADAFARGDFSLRIDPLEPADEGTYSCHLHHHYCGLHERRVFHLQVTEPAAAQPPLRDAPDDGSSHSSVPAPDPTRARGRSVINVIVPESRAHFFQQLGYVLATLLLFILLLITVILAARQRRRGGYEYSARKSGKPKGKDVHMAEFAVATGDQAFYRTEDIQLDYKNNILKEKAGLARCPPPAKHVDLDKEFRKEYCK